MLKQSGMSNCESIGSQIEANCKLSKPEQVSKSEIYYSAALMYSAVTTRPDIGLSKTVKQ